MHEQYASIHSRLHPAGSSQGRHRRHANPFSLRHDVQRLDVAAHFGRRADIALDIGCGPGAFVSALARARPHDNVLGLEIRAHLVAASRARLQAEGVRHADVVLANANLHLDTLLCDGSVSMVCINFADPWFKKRHHKRRVVTPHMASVLSRKLVPSGEIHVMTDVLALAMATRQTLRAAGFVDTHDAEVWAAQSTTGLSSERELWHLCRGDEVFRMCLRAPSERRATGPDDAVA